jgi:hypothetical protein
MKRQDRLMTTRPCGRSAIMVSLWLGVLGCTRDNPAFGDRVEGSEDGAITGETAATSFTGGATDSASGTGETGSEAGERGETGTDGVCGDGMVGGDEECDKGEKNSNVGHCKLDCTANVCGDGFQGPREACDQPEDTSGEFCTADCTLPTCNNGVLDPREPCDPSQDRGPSDCTRICTVNTCGDGYALGDEGCDEGMNNANEGACKLDCSPNVCGDGFRHEGVEQCEDNLPLPTTCMDLGFFAGEPSCVMCMITTDGCHDCGNGIVDEGEQCDPADPNGPGDIATPCGGNPGWTGMGSLACDSCLFATEGGCCKNDGQPCDADLGTNVFCCSQFCDPGAGTCGG